MDKLPTHGNRGFVPLLSAFMLCGMFAGCASTPNAPTEALQAAELAIAKAEQDRASNYASLELGEAREKLTAARIAVAEKEMLRAARLAEQSRADAELAIAKTQAAKAGEINAELDRNADTLQREIERHSGGAL